MKTKTTPDFLQQLEQATGTLLGDDVAANAAAAALKVKTRRRVSKSMLAAVLLPAAGLPGLTLAAEPGEWDIDTAILIYSESDDRVQAVEPVISGTRRFEGERSLNFKLALDALTGASPNGAVPSSQPQTYTQPSGAGQFTTPANTIPLDDTFRDTRIALSGGWKQPLAENWDGSVGLALSKEYDYQSIGLNGGVSYDFAQNNATLSLGVGYAADSIDPEGGVPIEGSCNFGASASTGCTETSFDETRRGSSESKDTLDLLFGYSQVLGKNTVAQFNLTLSMSDGYHNDPFKIVSVVGADGEPVRHLHESRPDSRSKTGFFTRLKHYLFNRDVIDTSYRFQTDDWGLSSHTLDMRYRWQFRDNQTLTPHFRYYTQSAVDFYQPYLRDGEALPTNYTADYRQGSFDGITLGLEYGYQFSAQREIRLALEFYQQDGDDPANAPGQLAGKELFPDMNAVMLRVNFDFDW